MAFKPLIDEYKRTPLPALVQSEKLWLEDELRKLERVLQNHSQLLNLRYGVFSDTTDQFAASVNTAYAISFNTTDFSQGVSIGSPTSKIIVDKQGIYNFQFSLQLDKLSSAAGYVYIWPRVNGVNIPNSATKVIVQGPIAEVVPAWNFVLQMNNSDYFELMWSTDDIGCHISHEVAVSPVPAIPSAILTVSQVI